MPPQQDEFAQYARPAATPTAAPKDEFAQFARPAATPQPMPAGSFQTMKGAPVQQVSQLGAQPLQYATPGAAVSGAKARAALPEFQQQLTESKKSAREMLPEVGSTLGSVSGLPGMAVGSAIGKAMEPAMEGGKPDIKGGAEAGAVTYAGGKALEYGGGLATKAAGKLLGKISPERLADLSALPEKAKQFQQSAWKAVNNAREMITKAYPDVKVPVDVSQAASISRQALQDILYRPEKEAAEFELLGKMGKIPRPVGDLPEGLLPKNLADALKALDASPVTTSFENAQRLNTALNEAIEGNRGKLTSDLYHSLKATQASMQTALREAAKADNKLPEYLAANKKFARYMNDFFNPGAPLKKVLKSQPDQFVIHFNELMNPAKRAGITEALERYGVSTADIKAVLERGDTKLKADIKDAARLKQLGPAALQRMSSSAAKEQLKQEAIKRGIQLALGAGAYGLYKKGQSMMAPAP